MAEPARRPRARDPEAPSLDPATIERAYRRERARRRQRVERRTEARRSNVRFWLALAALILLTGFLVVTVWNEVQRIFGI